MQLNEILKILKKNQENMEIYHIKKIGLFGSFAIGDANEKSDIDILVEFENGYKDFFNYMRLKFFLEELFNREVDLVMLKALKPELKERILKEVKYA